MDSARVKELRSWAHRLEDAASEELRAAGRAIRMLVDEVESLQSRLARAESSAREAASSPPTTAQQTEEPAAEVRDPEWEGGSDDRYEGSFFSRLKRSFGVD